jgi:hypothetical protein
MRKMAALLAVLCPAVLICSLGDGLAVAPAAAQQQAQPRPPGPPPVDKFSVVSQEWHRFPGLAVADITFNNANDYRVRNPVISCEFLGPNGKAIATRGSTIFQSFPPGKKKIDGVEFSLREKNATPGSCRVISVTTVSGPN